MEKNKICVGSCKLKLLDEIVNKVLDPETIVVFTTAPASRTALGEYFSKNEFNAQEKIVGFFKMLGADFVFDTAFGADLTTLAESFELGERIESGQKLPLLNSCCPAFKKYVENFHKDLSSNLSTARTPIAMTSLFVKTIFAQQKGIDPSKIYIVALTPCIAKKFEIKGDFLLAKELLKFKTKSTQPYKKKLSQKQKKLLNLLKQKQAHCNFDCNFAPCRERPQCAFKLQLTDAVLTTSELKEIIELSEINFDDIPSMQCDVFSGQSLKFGASGGVAESVVQCLLHSKNIQPTALDFQPTNEDENIFTCKIKVDDNLTLNLAKVVGLKHFTEMSKQSDFANYHFVEVMNCKGGCIGGTGQPTQDGEILEKRKLILQKNKDKNFAFENQIAVDVFKNCKTILFDEKNKKN